MQNHSKISNKTVSDLLEKSRVVNQNDGDRNFHIFYQMLSNGFDNILLQQMGLTNKANQYRFLNQGNKTVDANIDDSTDAVETEVLFFFSLLLSFIVSIYSIKDFIAVNSVPFSFLFCFLILSLSLYLMIVSMQTEVEFSVTKKKKNQCITC